MPQEAIVIVKVVMQTRLMNVVEERMVVRVVERKVERKEGEVP